MTTPAADPRQPIGSWAVPAGDPLKITLTISGPSGPVDLTAYGSAWSAMLRETLYDASPVTFTVSSTNAATGVLVLSLTAAQTTAMNNNATGVTVYQFDIQATGGTVTPQTPFKGTVTVYGVNTHG